MRCSKCRAPTRVQQTIAIELVPVDGKPMPEDLHPQVVVRRRICPECGRRVVTEEKETKRNG